MCVPALVKGATRAVLGAWARGAPCDGHQHTGLLYRGLFLYPVSHRGRCGPHRLRWVLPSALGLLEVEEFAKFTWLVKSRTKIWTRFGLFKARTLLSSVAQGTSALNRDFWNVRAERPEELLGRPPIDRWWLRLESKEADPGLGSSLWAWGSASRVPG